ncbi:MAG: AAA family ATPase [archaeon]
MQAVAIVGMTGSGKSEIAKILSKRKFKIIRFGDATDKVLQDQKLPLTEENERKTREALREKYGMDAYAKLNLPRIQEAIKTTNVVLDGLYSWEEYLFLKNKLPKMIVLAVYAPPETRYERLDQREVRSLTREQASGRDRKEIENLNKAAPIAMADYTLLNVGTLYDLENAADKFLEWLTEEEESE